MRDEMTHKPYRVVIITLDSHAAGPAYRVAPKLAQDFPGLELAVHAAAEWAECPSALSAAKAAIASADLIIANMLFLEEHAKAVMPDLQARRDNCDAMVCMIADSDIVKLTRMGELDMAKPASGAMALLKKLRGSGKAGAGSGAKQMKMLRRLPKILRLIPGKAQDLRAWFLAMQYWLGGSDDNVDGLIRFLISRYADRPDWQGAEAAAPIDYPEVGLYHPPRIMMRSSGRSRRRACA